MIIHLLSIDIVLGVLGGGAYASMVLGVTLPMAWWFVVPGAAWCVYTIDRILDARRIGTDYPTIRHQFHVRHAAAMVRGVGVIGVATVAVGVGTLPPVAIGIGLGVACLFGLHHVFQRSTRSPLFSVVKDINVAVAYGLAIWGVPVYMASEIDLPMIAAIAAHMSMVVATIVAEARADVDMDTRLGQPNIARVLTQRGTAVVHVMFAAILVGAAWMVTAEVLPIVIGWLLLLLVLPRIFATRWPMPIRRMIGECTLALPLVVAAIQP